MATYNIASLDIQKDGNTYHLVPGTPILVTAVPFGVCTTAAGTVAKVVTTFPAVAKLQQGTSVKVQFEKENTAKNPTLNVCSLGAIPIFCASDSSKLWNAGAVVEFTYDGDKKWIMNDATPVEAITESEIQSIFATL